MSKWLRSILVRLYSSRIKLKFEKKRRAPDMNPFAICLVIFILQSLQLFKNSLPDPCVLGNTIRRIGNKRNHETAIITRLLTMHMQ